MVTFCRTLEEKKLRLFNQGQAHGLARNEQGVIPKQSVYVGISPYAFVQEILYRADLCAISGVYFFIHWMLDMQVPLQLFYHLWWFPCNADCFC